MAQLLLLHLVAAAAAPWLARVLRSKAFLVLALAPATSFTWVVSVSGDVRAGNLPKQRISWVPGLGLDLDVRLTTLSWVLGCSSPASAHLVGRAAYRNRCVDADTLAVDELSDALRRSRPDPPS